MTTYYAGIGSRQTPTNVLRMMEQIAGRMAEQGFVLRSGGADGADTAFEMGAVLYDGPREIYIPWNGFNKRLKHSDGIICGVTDAALELASQFHPNWGACSSGARALHARNCYQVLGYDLKTPSARIICWTPNGSGSGGTGQAIRIARAHSIRVDDLGNPVTFEAYHAALSNPEN